MVLFEKELLKYLNLPSIPKKEWDGKSSYDKGVAIVCLADERKQFAVSKFDKNRDSEPRIVKTFGYEPFVKIERILVVPEYMATAEDIDKMDLDEQSKKKAEEILKEAKEIENEGKDGDDELTNPKNEYYFDNIHNDEEARAFIKSYNETNRIKRGKIPSTHEGLIMRLAVIYSDTLKKLK